MLLEELDLHIPDRLIAQEPAEPRDSCRLMHLGACGERRHHVFRDLPDLLRPGDTLVFNDSRVIPGRVDTRKPSGGAVELLFLRPSSAFECGPGSESWEVLARPSQRLQAGGELVLPGGERLVVAGLLGEGRWVVKPAPGSSLVEVMETYGQLPLPPYIKTYPDEPSSYQTVYADVPGSAAAPTAGLHFTPGLLERLAEAGTVSAFVTLHVGLDTFLPIREQVVEEHRIHEESFSVSSHALRIIRAAREAGNRLVAVGTTATRVLETLASTGALDRSSGDEAIQGATEIFITPGYRFQAVDALVTNLHLPRSSVLALTMAFAGIERLRQAYQEAVALEYRFFSFGDAMLIDAPTEAGEETVAVANAGTAAKGTPPPDIDRERNVRADL